MVHDNLDFFVLTGGPGAGKTTVIEALAARGEQTTREAGRAVIAAHPAGAPPPWVDPILFAELMLDHEIAEYERVRAYGDRVFFDRGVPDVSGYLNLMGYPVTERIRVATGEYGYNQKAFLFPPWRDIYVQDAERHQDFAEAERTFRIIAAAYRDLGYTLIEVPRATISDRVEFILSATRS